MQVQEIVLLEGVDERCQHNRMIDVCKGKIFPEDMAGHSSASREGGGNATQLGEISGEISKQDFFSCGNVPKMSTSPSLQRFSFSSHIPSSSIISTSRSLHMLPSRPRSVSVSLIIVCSCPPLALHPCRHPPLPWMQTTSPLPSSSLHLG